MRRLLHRPRHNTRERSDSVEGLPHVSRPRETREGRELFLQQASDEEISRAVEELVHKGDAESVALLSNLNTTALWLFTQHQLSEKRLRLLFQLTVNQANPIPSLILHTTQLILERTPEDQQRFLRWVVTTLLQLVVEGGPVGQVFYQECEDVFGLALQHNPRLREVFRQCLVAVSSQEMGSLSHQLLLLRLILKIQASGKDLIDPDVVYTLAGQALSISSFTNYGLTSTLLYEFDIPLFSPADHARFVGNVLKAQVIRTPEHAGKIIFNFAGSLMINFGPEALLEILHQWYQSEPVPTFRHGFHLSYIWVINQGQSAEFMLNRVAQFLLEEHNLDILTDVFVKLKVLDVDWSTLEMVMRAIFENPSLQDNYWRQQVQDLVVNAYLTDLESSDKVNLIYQTQYTLISIWEHFPDLRGQMWQSILRWVSNGSTSTTIKALVLEALLTRSTNSRWSSMVEDILGHLGPRRVRILNDRSDTTVSLDDWESSPTSIPEGRYVESYDSVLHCSGCRKSLTEVVNQCSTCHAMFCPSCLEGWQESVQNQGGRGTNLCLGSMTYGSAHNMT